METTNNSFVKQAIVRLPTRWGTQLNGNLLKLRPKDVSCLLPTRWGTQLNGNLGLDALADRSASLPTRWGTQLNGNNDRLIQEIADKETLPTRWGTQLNGNPRKHRSQIPVRLRAPHSLGNPIKWKHLHWLRPDHRLRHWSSPLAGEPN